MLGSDRIGLRIGSDWQFALNSRQKWSRDILGMKMAERTNLLILFVFFFNGKVISRLLERFPFQRRQLKRQCEEERYDINE